MKTTDEKRREVARRLRDEGLYASLMPRDQFFRWMFNVVDSPKTVASMTMHLADLIEPAPEWTCRNDSTKSGKGVFLCSECSIHLDMAEMDEENLDAFYEPNFCPNCGALVEGADR
jgi:hypothetical protein|nr:MAG TPA: hypothetical protein [Caudoviricetes sp.]